MHASRVPGSQTPSANTRRQVVCGSRPRRDRLHQDRVDRLDHGLSVGVKRLDVVKVK